MHILMFQINLRVILLPLGYGFQLANENGRFRIFAMFQMKFEQKSNFSYQGQSRCSP